LGCPNVLWKLNEKYEIDHLRSLYGAPLRNWETRCRPSYRKGDKKVRVPFWLYLITTAPITTMLTATERASKRKGLGIFSIALIGVRIYKNGT